MWLGSIPLRARQERVQRAPSPRSLLRQRQTEQERVAITATKHAVLRDANTAGCAASCYDEAGVPTGRSTSCWRLGRVGVHASTHEQPRDQ